MLFSALIVPLAGIFTLAISNFYSVQEYPIGYFLDLLHSAIRRGSFEERSAQESAEVKQSIETGVSSESVAQNIETEFTKIHKRSALRKYVYVFLSPLLVTLSIVHTLLIFCFLDKFFTRSHSVWTVWCAVLLFNRLDCVLCDSMFTSWCSTYSCALGRCGMDSDHCFYCSGYCLLYMCHGKQLFRWKLCCG